MFTDKEKAYIRWLVSKQTFEEIMDPKFPFSAKDIVQLGHSINAKLRDDGKSCSECLQDKMDQEYDKDRTDSPLVRETGRTDARTNVNH